VKRRSSDSVSKELRALVRIQKQRRIKHGNGLTMLDIMHRIQILIRCLPVTGPIRRSGDEK
jgi:hypothetical protein